ncbi:MAG: hypothetical protein ACRD1X_22270 [Vicinamibacteria bacterium]
MGATTYRDLFQHALEESIRAYGEISRVVILVSVYQGADPIARQYAFDDWVEGTSFSCGLCGRTFTPDPDEVEEVCRRLLRAVHDGGPAMTTEGRTGTRVRTKTYKVSLRVEQLIYAEDKEEALGIFWDDLMRNLAEGEVAIVGEVG